MERRIPSRQREQFHERRQRCRARAPAEVLGPSPNHDRRERRLANVHRPAAAHDLSGPQRRPHRNGLQQRADRSRPRGWGFFFLSNGPVLPYAGANIGFGWATLQTAAADIAIYDNQSSVALGLEAGALVNFGGSRAPMLLLGARYTAEPVVSFLSSVKDVQSVVLQVGLIGR